MTVTITANFVNVVINPILSSGQLAVKYLAYRSAANDYINLNHPGASLEERDAYRHAYVSSQFTQDYGNDFATFLGAVNEALLHIQGDNPPDERAMDLFNNQVGRETYLNNTSLTNLELQNLLWDKTQNGDLITDADSDDGDGIDPRLAEPMDPGIEIQEDALDALEELTPDFEDYLEQILEDNPYPVYPDSCPISPLWQDFLDEHDDSKNEPSPLVLDLDGDGVETRALAGGAVYFDHNHNGFAEATGWVSADDGLLAIDLNSDGVINDGTELFGDQTGQTNGFLALKQYDSNSDNRITSADANWNNLRVWQDANSDGSSQAGELKTLNSLGISEINLDYTTVTLFNNGNDIKQNGRFTINGAVRTVSDVYFAADPMNSTYNQDYTLDVRTLFLPTLRGYGTLPDLHIAMSLDNAGLGNLLDKVSAFTSQSFADLFDTGNAALMDVRDIMLRWAGVENVVAGSRGPNVDAQELEFLEEMTGEDYLQMGAWSNPYVFAGLGLSEAFDEALKGFYARLVMQSAGQELIDGTLTYNPTTDDFTLDGSLDLTNIDALETEALALGTTNARAKLWGNVLLALEHSIGIDNLSLSDQAALEDAIFDSDATLDIADCLAAVAFQAPDEVVTNGTTSGETINGGALNDIINANAGADTLNGNVRNDRLFGEAGNDTLNGGDDDDYLEGGGDNDTYVYNLNTGTDTIEELSGTDKISFGAGIAIGNLSMARVGNTNLVITVNNGITPEEIVIQNHFLSGKGIETLQFADLSTFTLTTQNWTLNGTAGNDVLEGVNYNGGTIDTINAGDGNDTIYGFAGNDTLNGGNGNDTIDGGTGVDTMAGGSGDDIYIVDTDSDVVTENNNEGTDSIIATVSSAYTLGANFENGTLGGTNSINLTGNALNNILTGNSGNNTIFGGDGNDIVDGGAGNDTLRGEAGDDIYIVDSSSDNIVESSGAGYDTIRASATFTMGSNVEALILIGAAAISATGNTLDNILTGNGAANTLNGNDGNDTIDGGLGADLLNGGAGDDTYYVDNTSDVVSESVSSGTDIVYASASFTINGNVENLILTGTSNINGTGNAGVNIITGNSGNNTLNGGNAVDTLIGGLGDDTYVIESNSEIITENNNEGNDTIISTIPSNYTLGAHIENLTITGSNSISITGNSLNNVLTGNSGNNTVTGGDGNDTIDGGNAIDTLIGGAGDDIYITESNNDVITELANEGTDKIIATVSASYTLGAHIENLTLGGTNSINATGNALNNLLIGNSGANTLDGVSGDDSMAGAAGNDIYIVNSASDVVTENANEGTDLVQSSVTYTLTDNIENLTLTGTSNLNGTGNGLANTITGNSGINILDGGAGNDTLIGGAGDDTYIVDSSADVITEGSSAGTDNVQSSAAAYTLGSNVENLTLTGVGNINGTGNSSNNTITGNSGNNILNGGSGIDTMIGGLGDDFYLVDHASDVTTENLGEGTDSVQSSITWTLANNIENLTLTGSSGIHATGNGLDNVLTGNSGSNTITGGAGNDTLDGGNAIDTLIGGLGDDIYITESNNDVITENLNEGTDHVFANTPSTYVLGANLENLTIMGTSTIGGTGNGLDNIITGNGSANTLTGNAGNDTLYGGGGNDTLHGGNDNDILSGQAGTDSLTGGIGSDTFVFENASAFSNVDTITDFSTAQSDKLNIADLLVGYNSGTSDINDFVSLAISGSNSNLFVDRDGTGSTYSSQQIGILSGVTGLDVDDLLNNGNLIV
ncbi:MAG TPA: type I secretion C-terminal target domain-containing protein [Chitinophagaceae bacterium]|nr:type I secretion C-terminal target domain-containing protein [Chitinophagaceae bacterium]